MRVSGLVQPQVFQDLVDHLGFLNTCDHFHLAAALVAFLYGKDTLKLLSLGYRITNRMNVCLLDRDQNANVSLGYTAELSGFHNF